MADFVELLDRLKTSFDDPDEVENPDIWNAPFFIWYSSHTDGIRLSISRSGYALVLVNVTREELTREEHLWEVNRFYRIGQLLDHFDDWVVEIKAMPALPIAPATWVKVTRLEDIVPPEQAVHDSIVERINTRLQRTGYTSIQPTFEGTVLCVSDSSGQINICRYGRDNYIIILSPVLASTGDIPEHALKKIVDITELEEAIVTLQEDGVGDSWDSELEVYD